MKRFLIFLIALLTIPAIVMGQAAHLTETFTSNTAKIQFGLPTGFTSVINTTTLSIRIKGEDELEFVVISPTSLDKLGYGDVTQDELIDALLGEDAEVDSVSTRNVEERDLSLVTFTEGDDEKVMILVPFDDGTFAIVRVTTFTRVRHLSALLYISASIENLAVADNTSAPPRTETVVSTRSITSDESNLSFEIPSDWTFKYLDDALALSLSSDDVELFVFTPDRIQRDGLGNIKDAEDVLTGIVDLYGWTLDDIESDRVDGRTVTIADYIIDSFRGILVAVELSNGSFVVADTIEWTSGRDTLLITDIVASFELIENIPTVDYSGDWQEVVRSLEDIDLISPGGGIVFVEERAFFTGQGNWFTPLASRSPQTNFVMSATLSYTPGDVYNGGDYETCSLLARLQDDPVTGIASRFIEVGIDNTEVLYYLSIDGNRQTNYDEFNVIDLGQSYHILFIVEENTISIFLDNQLIVDKEEIQFGSGTFGIALRGLGNEAECTGENIWVYSLPEVQDGICRVSSNSNVNRRTGPGTEFDIAGQLLAGTSQEVIARLVGDDNFVWWQLDDDSWVRNDVIELSGDCRDVGNAQADI